MRGIYGWSAFRGVLVGALFLLIGVPWTPALIGALLMFLYSDIIEALEDLRERINKPVKGPGVVAYFKPPGMDFPDDVERLVQIAYARGVMLHPIDAHNAWEDRSDDVKTGWLVLPDDDAQVWRELKPWLNLINLKGE